jgi:aminomethyltransferase
MQKESKTTPLHDWHTAQGANMADFGGYEMPLWYSTARTEHLSVLTNAGIFDTSHMAVVMVAGPEAYDLLQLCFTNNLAACTGKNKGPLVPGRSIYGAYLNEKGEVIDDTIINQLAENSYMAVVNAGMGDLIARHLAANTGGRKVEIIDLTNMVGKIDVQGPMAAKILSKLVADPENVFNKMPYFSFKGHFDAASPLSDTVRLTDGTPILLSRTGYTGEFGFEIFVSTDHTARLWEMVLEAGSDFDIVPCGLAARDSLRAGAVLPLSHQDIGAWPFINHPWSFALPYNDDQTAFVKSFIGDQALLAAEGPEYTYPFAGNDFRKVSAEDPAVVLDSEGRKIGRVLTCVTDMGIGRHEDRIYSIASPDKPPEFKAKGLCCGFMRVSTKMDPGQDIDIKDSRRTLTVTIVDDIRPHRTARRPIAEML